MPRTNERILSVLRGMSLCALITAAASAQDESHAVTLFGNVVTSAKIFFNPASPDPFERNATNDISSMLSGSLQYGFAMSDISRLQVAFEYLYGSETSYDNYNTEIVDGFRMYGVELSGIFLLPVSGKRFMIYIGGGGGAYWGTREYSLAGLFARAPASNLSFGILTIFGLEYRVLPPLSLKLELRFRDPQIDTENEFGQPTLDVQGVTYHLPTRPFPSKVNVNGNVYSLGVCWAF